MRVEPLLPDLPPAASQAPADAAPFARALDEAGSILRRAEKAEDDFAAGSGDLQRAVYERARADVVLAVATSAAQRCAQGLNTLLSMQI